MADKPESIKTLLASITPEIHQQLKTAVELGHWENGEKLTKDQKEYCMQAVIAYDNTFMQPEQRIGYINQQGNTCSDSANRQIKKQRKQD
jgi:uncharacterized protein